MSKNALTAPLKTLLKLPAGTEWIEFKEAKKQFDFNKLGLI